MCNYDIFVAKTRNYDILSRKFMITRSSIAFVDFLGSSIAPQVMPPCRFVHTIWHYVLDQLCVQCPRMSIIKVEKLTKKRHITNICSTNHNAWVYFPKLCKSNSYIRTFIQFGFAPCIQSPISSITGRSKTFFQQLMTKIQQLMLSGLGSYRFS